MSSRPVLLALCLALGACTTPKQSQETPAELSNPLTKAPPIDSPQVLRQIAFGSCSKQNLPQVMWRKLQEEKPELFVWTGDVIYADTHDMSKLARLYQFQLQQPEYAGFLSSGTPVIGIYDDHDFGKNDSGKEFREKAASQKLFLDFIGEAKDSPRRQQAGIYQSYRFGTEGQRLKILLLDTRYHREQPGQKADILGAQQWDWLTRELSTPDADLVLLISSIQVLPNEHKFEKWANFPASRQRLLDLIAASPSANIAIVSGDRHLAEISKLTLASGREVYELTSSGLTHSFREAVEDSRNVNSLRVGALMPRLNYGWLSIDWTGQDPHFTLEARDINKQAILRSKIPLRRSN